MLFMPHLDGIKDDEQLGATLGIGDVLTMNAGCPRSTTPPTGSSAHPAASARMRTQGWARRSGSPETGPERSEDRRDCAGLRCQGPISGPW
jgi:hypothetical protein